MRYLSVWFWLFIMACSQPQGNSIMQGTDSTAVKGQPVAAVHQTPAADRLIVPGKSIGQSRLGEPEDSLLGRLGKPDMSDAAMGKAMLTWYSRHEGHTYQLNVFVHYADSTMTRKAVSQMRVTSPYFRTRDNLGVGSAAGSLFKFYKELKPVATDASGTLYDDNVHGVAFQIKGDTCRGVIVHEAGLPAGQTYINYPAP